MPLLQEHIAIGLAILAASQKLDPEKWHWQSITAATLSIASDFDALPGFFWRGDWHYYHRQGAHSLFYSILAGYLAVLLLRLVTKRELLSPWIASAIALSHVVADYLFSPWQVELYWPLPLACVAPHEGLLRLLAPTGPTPRAWFIDLSCLAVILLVYWHGRQPPQTGMTPARLPFMFRLIAHSQP